MEDRKEGKVENKGVKFKNERVLDGNFSVKRVLVICMK